MAMRITFTEEYAKVAIQHALAVGVPVSSEKRFVVAVKNYMFRKDEEDEYGGFREQAIEIVEKYYNNRQSVVI